MNTIKKLSPTAITAIIIGVVAVIVAIFSISTYNDLAKQDQAVKAKWSQVENVMERRADLIPNLTAAVKGSMSHETKIFDDIAKARQNYYNADSTTAKASADNEVNKSVGTLLNVISESYPTLASNDNVKTLMTQLEGSENRISVERKRYIEAVQDYNSSLVTFPRNLFANLMGLKEKPEFKADPEAYNVPKVDLSE
ncbi:LemA family protein [Lacticaseibacillus mingshuiensis]|uniref:LemA family protein n=1 Tax=Lacticaseibacillus mingshuiensis TaxID=2799574 RepID=UPI00194EDAB3|nr:LemA family protein [Lacticaseibacillus mingshuiensis]